MAFMNSHKIGAHVTRPKQEMPAARFSGARICYRGNAPPLVELSFFDVEGQRSYELFMSRADFMQAVEAMTGLDLKKLLLLLKEEK